MSFDCPIAYCVSLNDWLFHSFPVKFPHSPILHYAFSSWIEKTTTKQYITLRKTDLFYNGMGLCGNLPPWLSTHWQRHLNIIFAPWGREFECANYQKFLSLERGVAPGCAGCWSFRCMSYFSCLKKQIIPVFHTGEGKGNGTRKPNRYRMFHFMLFIRSV